MWSQLAILAGLSLSAVVSAAPVDTRLTNAERIQRGLPLNAPKKRYNATRTRALVPRASGDGTTPSVVQVSPVAPSKRSTLDKRTYVVEWLMVNTTSGQLTMGTQVENSLQLNLPNAAQADDFIVTTSDGPGAQFVSSVNASSGGADVVRKFELTSTSDGGVPQLSVDQSSIWTYAPASGSLMADYFPASGGPLGLYFGAPTDGSGDLVGMTDQSLLLNQQAYTFKAMSISDAANVMNIGVESNHYAVTMPGSEGLYLQYDQSSDRFIFINDTLTNPTCFKAMYSATDLTKRDIQYYDVGHSKWNYKYSVLPSPPADANTDTDTVYTGIWTFSSTLSGLEGYISANVNGEDIMFGSDGGSTLDAVVYDPATASQSVLVGPPV
ncbi:hypothetical protein EHS25_006354 [Saitozyma podzolica]|uniref:Uncharacterized protein n=1 Tax=Saitozyma podzolica TaxID=1890683 RepID=A0A427YRK7_9TREE|nr:hypothetical protein EHS25_006354 [Saitozyma podzolica]